LVKVWNCKNCGNTQFMPKYKDESLYCPNCGEKVGELAPRLRVKTTENGKLGEM